MHQTIGFSLHHIAAALASTNSQLLEEQLGITYAHYRLLQVICSADGLRQNEAARRLGQTEASVSRMLKTLIKLGYVSKTNSPVSKREYSVTATPKGLKLVDHAASVVHSQEEQLLNGLTDKQRAQFMEFIEQMHQNLCGVDTHL